MSSQPSNSATTSKDNLFARPIGNVAEFVFNDDVVSVFPDMIKRSVPGYETIIAMTGTLAEKYVNANSQCYDLGCSLGASTLAIANNTKDRANHIVAVDNSPAMIEHCQHLLRAQLATAQTDGHQTNKQQSLQLLCNDLLNVNINNASMVVLNFTLQFVAVEKRNSLISDIYQGLNKGGILVLSEKLAFSDEHLNSLMIDLHHRFKQANGYSQLEISQKRSALENVLIPETLSTHKQRLTRAGFTAIEVWFQCFNFASIIAIK